MYTGALTIFPIAVKDADQSNTSFGSSASLKNRQESQMETGVPAAVELKNDVDSKVREEETSFADIDKVGENNIMKPENATKLTKLFVRNIPNNLNGAFLAAKFQDFRIPVTNARIYENRGVGFVVVNLADHDRALGLSNKIRILGRSIGIEVFNARNARENQGSQTSTKEKRSSP
ncbi:hypothetical protein B0H13DRAFT_1886584 [Mycena leptocephala]|nr:hypothetical protein B0H13DRAFT_1886584 [Mycena leptocephala]